jgi:hypothetical protein
MRLLIGGEIVGFSTFILTHLSDQDRWALGGLAGFVVVGCIVWPGTIMITDTGVQQYVWWRRVVTIPWGEVTAIEKSPSNDYFVHGLYGQRIAFDKFHVDAFRFKNEVELRAKVKVIDSTAPATLRI